MIARALRLSSCLAAVLLGSAIAAAQTPDFVPPPRSVADITAILDQERPNAAAIASYTKVADAAPPADLAGIDLAKFYGTRAAAAAAIGRIAQSVADLHQALAVTAPIQDQQKELYLSEMNQLRSIISRSSDSAGAIALSRQIIDVTQGKGQPNPRTVEAYQTLISYTAEAGQLDDANAQAQQLKQLVDQLSQAPSLALYRAGFAWSLDRSLGVIAMVSGRLDEAESDFRRALPEGQQEAKDAASINPVLAEGWKSAASYSYRDLAFTLQDEGRLEEAEVAARQALLNELDVHGRYAVETVDMISALAGIIAAEGRYPDSAKLAQIAIDTYATLGIDPSSRMLNNARGTLVADLMGEGRAADALAQVDLVMKGLADDPDYRRRALRANPSYITAAMRGGRTQDAVAWAREAMEEAERVFGASDARAAIQIGLYAEALMAIGDDATARANFAKAVPILLDTANESFDQSGQTRVDRWRTAVLDGYLDLLAKDGDTDAAIEAFRVADAARGQNVQRAVAAAASRAAARDPALADLTRREQDAERQIDALTATLANGYAQPSAERDDAALAKLRSQIDELTAQRKTMRGELARQFPDYVRLTNPEPATVAQAQAALHAGEALIAIYVAPDRTYLWAVQKGAPPAFALSPLTRAEIDTAVTALRASVDPDAATAGDIPAFDVATAYKLYAGLLDPVKQGWHGGSDLLIVANGSLGQIPFGMLATENVKPAADADGQPLFNGYKAVPWLIRQVAITQLPSVTSLTTLRAMPAPPGQRKPFIGFGDPWFSAAEAKEALAAQAPQPPQAQQATATAAVATRGAPVHLRSAPKTEGIDTAELAELPRLPDTAEEVKDVAAALGADPVKDVYLGAQANEQVVRTVDLDDRRVIMFATHGLVPGDLDGLTEPALALSAPDVAHVPGDGLLTVSKILSLHLDADWVVLSACNTAAGEGAGAEAVSGLGLAFFYAGSRALLVSNWPVETTSARFLTTELFKREAATPGIARAEALRQAMLALIDGPGMIDPTTQKPVFSYAHPIFWAPFSLVGDGAA